MTMRPLKRDGFTVMELLVAVAISVLILLLINQVFTYTTRAVSIGLATSKLVGNSRTASSQMAMDARWMHGPNRDGGSIGSETGGFIAIANYIVPAQNILTDTGAMTQRPIRSDQLIFIRRNDSSIPERDRLYPVTPANTTTFTPDSNVQPRAAFVRIWYGHVRLTSEQGVDPFLSLTVDERTDNMDDRPASSWALGRQALHLVNRSTAGLLASVRANNDGWSYDSTVTHYGAGSAQPLIDASGNVYVFHGLTDVSNPTALVTGGPESNLFQLNELLNGDSVPNYFARIARMAFVRKRLRACPMPLYEEGSSWNLASWQIAQTHALFMQNVSDFAIEFAGDYEAPFGQMDVDALDRIRWYGFWFNNPITNLKRDPNNPSATIPYDPGEPDVYFPPLGDFDGATPDNPFYVESEPLTDGMFVWRHTDDEPSSVGVQGSRWPYLIRMRYRMHDPNGRLTGRDGNPGMWFETIIPVNRP